MAEAPLLSQDEFFRHLNLQSVHQTSAKYHYRQALKERLRASSYAKLALKNSVKSEPEEEKKSPQVSPCKWLNQAQFRKIFGRPRIRMEKREFELSSNGENGVSILNPLIQNCHVLRHPGIKKEFQFKHETDDFLTGNDKRSQIKIRKNYLPETNRRNRICDLVLTDEIRAVVGQNDAHCKSVRPQPGKRKSDQILEHEKHEKPAMVAKLNRLLERTSTPAIVRKEPVLKPVKKPRFPRICLSGSTTKLLGSPSSPSTAEKLPLRPSRAVNVTVKAVKVELKKPKPVVKPHRISKDSLKVKRTDFKVVVDVKSKFGTSMSTCRVCGRRFKFSSPLKNWKEALESNQSHFCGICKTLIHSEDQEESEAGSLSENKCDICSKKFGNRSNMIRHITNNHPLNMHKVELAKFAGCKTQRNGHNKNSQTGSPSWLNGPPTYLKTIAAQAQ